jgi:hypothetical protein
MLIVVFFKKKILNDKIEKKILFFLKNQLKNIAIKK